MSIRVPSESRKMTLNYWRTYLSLLYELTIPVKFIWDCTIQLIKMRDRKEFQEGTNINFIILTVIMK